LKDFFCQAVERKNFFFFQAIGCYERFIGDATSNSLIFLDLKNLTKTRKIKINFKFKKKEKERKREKHFFVL